MPKSYWAAAGVIAIALVAGGCGGTGKRAAAPAARPSATSPSPRPAAPSTSPPAPLRAKNGTDLRSCRDGVCEVVVKDGQRIPMDPDFGFGGAVEISVTGGGVTFTSADGTLVIGPQGVGESGTFNDAVTFVPRVFRDGSAVVRVRRGG